MSKPRKIKMAIAYDFDGTLSPGNMQNYDFIPALGMTTEKFWKEVKSNAEEHDMDEILSYLELMLKKAQQQELSVKREDFRKYGSTIKLLPGVDTWFKRINEYASEHEVKIFHYIISSGLREMIEGTKIKRYFERIYASGYKYDQHHVAVWPAVAVNYTTKIQFLFRINKGIPNTHDNSRINKYTPEEDRPMPFRNMVYIGDGETDIPCMKMIKYQNGHAIAVYQKGKKGSRKNAQELIDQDRADFALLADYNEDSKLSKAVKEIIQKIAADNRLRRIS